MGAWGVGSFENDMAGDWSAMLRESDNLVPVHHALRQVTDSDCYLDSDPACEAIAACEVVARLKGHWGVRNADTEIVDAWVDQHPQPVSDELVTLALAAIDRVLGPNSELRELWEESDSAEAWRRDVEDLRRRVSV